MTNSDPGDILLYDFRQKNLVADNTGPLKVVQWNIERGYQLDKVISELKELDADIITLQEVDIGCKRSGEANQMSIICEALGVKGGFLVEFVELESPLRSKRDQGGGTHGNAILSKFDMKFHVIDHKHQPVDWPSEGDKLKEPRIGRRFTLVAEIDTPHKKTLCYSAHLEVFCGLTGRIAQFSEILEHSHLNSSDYPFQLVFGDLNTMAHSIARLSPKYCCDVFRWRSLGFSEAEWWCKNVLSWHVGDGPRNELLEAAAPDLAKHPGLLEAARNPGLYDPWDPSIDITLDNASYYGLYKAKLDWTLLRGFEVLEKFMGNRTYTASDHSYLVLWIKRSEDLGLVEDPHRFHSCFPTPESWISGLLRKLLFMSMGSFFTFILFSLLAAPQSLI